MEMESDSEQSTQKKAETLQALVTGPLASTVAKLSGSSRGIPSEEDFHFFYNFVEFKGPIKEIAEKSESMLKSIGSSSYLWGKPLIFPDDSDEAYNWLVNINDEVLERFDVSVDEFQRLRKKEEERGSAISSMDSENGFQLVYGKKKKGGSRNTDERENTGHLGSVKTVSRDKKTMGGRSRVPFHIPTIPRPQDEYNILVNNSSQPFEHVWLQKSEDGSRFIHPLEKLSALDFVDRVIGDVEAVKPFPIESTPFKLVEEVKELKELAAKLHNVNEFAVDLEHNQYRSFQGMTCLIQISTRTEDFVIDTLKLRVHVGPYLREVFKDPSKKKVMHGADRDIMWLQRDFGIYLCNLFDTGQASRVLQLERNSLEYLLLHFCEVTANKEYQNADWRLRPIPDEMLKYAREDTHYLLHIYDLMKSRLLVASTGSENGDALLLEVYKRSYDTCMQLYEKEILTETSYLYIYGLQGADFNSQQLAIVAGLCQWRDVVARADDESTGYILPNKAVLDIARQMPLTAGKLRRLVKSKHPYVERNLDSVVSIIRSSIQNASAFEDAAEQLKKGRTETALEHNIVVADESEALPTPDDSTDMDAVPAQPEKVNCENGYIVKGQTAECISAASLHVKDVPSEFGHSTAEGGRCETESFFELSNEAGEIKKEPDSYPPDIPKESFTISGPMGGTDTTKGALHSTKAITGATVEVLKKPSRAFGALLGNSASKRKLGLDPKVEMKVEQIKSSVILPFHSFSGRNEQMTTLAEQSTKSLEIQLPKEPVAQPAEATKLEEIIPLESDFNDQEAVDNAPTTASDGLDLRENSGTIESDLAAEEEPMSLSELSSSFQKCFQSMNEKRNTIQTDRSQESDGLQLKPFDYAAARKQMRFGEKEEEGKRGDEGLRSSLDSKERRKTSSINRIPRDEGTKDFQQPRRRQAFPPTGNRSATFR